MPIMTRMRTSMPYVLFGLLIAFLVTIIFEWGMDYLGTGRNGGHDVVGKVNNKKITYKEFTDLLKVYSDNQKAQTGSEPDENQLRGLRDQVWQAIVTQNLVDEQIKKLGLTVTDAELRDWARGDNPPQMLTRNFVDSTGQFNRDAYIQAITDPRNREILAQVEPELRKQRLSEKLQSMVLATVRVPEGDIVQRFKDQRIQHEVLYALVDANQMVKDADVQVTDADIKAYYDENIDQYKVEASRTLKYVLFKEVASASDSSGRRSEIEDAAKKAQSGMDFVQLTGTYTDRVDSGAWFRHGEMQAELENALFSAPVGSIVGPRMESDGYHLSKILDQRKAANEYVRASHILFTFEGEKDTNAVKATARDVAAQAKAGKDFAELARKYSKDPGTSGRGGDLGWFTKGRMVKEFEAAVFKLRPGEVAGPIRTQFGIHVIKLVQKDAREIKVARIVLPIAPSAQTKNDIYERARDFAYNARKTDLVKEAQSLGLEVKESQVQEKGGVVPGVGVNESITRWAFKNGVGDVGEPFSIANGYVVFSIASKKSEGVKPLDEVKEAIKPLALRKKKLAKAVEMAAAFKAKLTPGDSLTKISTLNPAVTVQHAGPFTLATGAPGVGRDLNFIGAVSALNVGKISEPVSGFRGAYLIQLLSRSQFDSTAFKAERNGLMSQMLQEKKNRFLSDWITKLKDEATIEDDRENFFR
jgi:peptidyl-prolyl cis-trans isomerase D